jgi:thiosulfate/3-mercaptopyruvate sulfurtransferase
VNIPFNEIGDDRLHVKSRGDLEALFRKAGIAPSDTVVVYCHIGQQGTAVVLAARLLGQPVTLYDGSFDDWSRRTELPVETGKRDE